MSGRASSRVSSPASRVAGHPLTRAALGQQTRGAQTQHTAWWLITSAHSVFASPMASPLGCLAPRESGRATVKGRGCCGLQGRGGRGMKRRVGLRWQAEEEGGIDSASCPPYSPPCWGCSPPRAAGGSYLDSDPL